MMVATVVATHKVATVATVAKSLICIGRNGSQHTHYNTTYYNPLPVGAGADLLQCDLVPMPPVFIEGRTVVCSFPVSLADWGQA